MTSTPYDCIVIGAGVTGLSAASQLAGMGRSTAYVEPMMFGGLVINIRELEYGQVGDEPKSGIEFASGLMMEAMNQGAVNIREAATGIRRAEGLLEVITDTGIHRAGNVIIASGARLRYLGIPGESEFVGRGVSQCADCDGPMFKNETVVVVGGGDSALQEALVLSHFCKHIYLVNRGGVFRAKPGLVDAVRANPAIELIWNTEVVEVSGNSTVEGVRLVDNTTGEMQSLSCTGFFPWIGVAPNTDFIGPEVRRDERGFLLTDDQLMTSIPGVYAAGAVRVGYGGMLDHALTEGRLAARSADAALREWR
jgi:thioredoxin reductase (NADPH)